MAKFRAYFIVFAAMLVCFDTQAKLFNAQSTVLDNGLEVVLIPNHRAPIIKHMVWYKTGAVDEVAGKGGSAHLLEHLMFRGTPKISGQEFNRLMEENGAESNAFTGQDMTAYHQLLDISRLELAMFLEADRMSGLQIQDKDFELERDIVFQERKQRVDTNPLAQFGEEVRRVFWQGSAYGRPVSGVEEEILNLSKADVEAYYASRYAPQNAVLVLSGDIDFATAVNLAQKYYGKVDKKEQKLEKKEFAPFKKVQNRVEMELKDVQTPRLMQLYAVGSYHQNKQDVYPLQVLAAYMGDGETSKLYKKLVLQNKKALSVSVDYNPLSRSYGMFSIAAVPAPGVTVEELEQSLQMAWDEALAELSLDEIQKVKQKMLAGLVYLRDNPSDAAYIVGAMRSIGVDLAEIETQEEKLREVSYQQVRDVAKTLGSSATVTAVLRPKGDADEK